MDALTRTGVPSRVGADHAALAMIPFSLAVRGAPAKGTVRFEHQLTIDGHQRQIRVTLQPGESEILPTHNDQVIYLMLLQMALQRPEPEQPLEFQLSDLVAAIGLNDGGSSFERVKQGLRRLWDLGLIIETETVSRSGQPYIDMRMTKLINEVRISSGRGGRCYVEWGGIVRQAFALGDFKRLDWDLVLSIDNPTTVQLYRVLDRIALSGELDWSIGWEDLGSLLGMDTSSYARPARLKQVLTPHFETLIERGVLEHVDYIRGGTFRFQFPGGLRSRLREILIEKGVFPNVAPRLLAGYDEVVIMAQCDCVDHGSRGRPKQVGGYLTEAIQQAYELRYPPEEPEQFLGIWGMLDEREREAYHRYGLTLLGTHDSLFDTSDDPTAWSQMLRSVVRFLICHMIEPEVVG